MHNLKSYFSKFFGGTCPRAPLDQFSHKKQAKESIFPQNAREKVNFLSKTGANRSTVSQNLRKKSTFSQKAPPPPNPNLAMGQWSCGSGPAVDRPLFRTLGEFEINLNKLVFKRVCRQYRWAKIDQLAYIMGLLAIGLSWTLLSL